MNETPQKPRMIETYRISWSDIAALISEQIKSVLGYKCSLRVWPEDLDFWGVRAQHRTFSVRELNRLLDAVHASEKEREMTLPEDSEDTHSFGMTLGRLLLKSALQADWERELVDDDALWLIGFTSAETNPYSATGLLRNLDASALLSKEDVLTHLANNGGTDVALGDIRMRYYTAHKNELCWRYPISDGVHAGAFILVVKEGYLSLPYNSVDEEDYELLVLTDAALHDAESISTFLSDWEYFSADLTDAMREMYSILKEENDHA